MPSTDHLIWIDLEMTGLKPDRDVIIEIATVVTDRNLTVLGEGPNLAIHQPDEILAGMDEWNTKQHGASGLTARVKASTITTATPINGRMPTCEVRRSASARRPPSPIKLQRTARSARKRFDMRSSVDQTGRKKQMQIRTN